MTAQPLAAVLQALWAEMPRRRLLAGLLLAATTLLAGIALLGLSGWFISAAALAGLSAAGALAFDVFMPAAGIRLLALLRTGGRYGERLLTHDATLAGLAGLRVRLFRAWAQPGAARRLLARPARLLFRLGNDVDALDAVYLRLLVPAAAALAAAAAVGLGLGLLLSPGLGAALGATLLAGGLGLCGAAAWLGRRPARHRALALEALRARCIDLVAGQTELLMAGRLAAQRAALRSAERRLARADRWLNGIEVALAAAHGVLGSLLLAGCLLAGAGLVEAGRIDTPLAVLALLVVLASMEPFAALRRGAIEGARTLAAARRLGPALLPLPRAAPHPHPLPEGAKESECALRLSDVTARPPGAARPLFEQLSLTLASGERVALIGASGSGKSTLLALAAGEIAPQAGHLFALPCTLLTQRTELFHDSLRENLLLAAPGADDARLWDALRQAGLADVVQTLPDGLATVLGEGGLGLSGGQARRLALARLLLRDVPLWLLDEPSDGLDAETAHDVLQRLDTRAAGRSLLIATHLRREAVLADRLLLLDDGRLVGELSRGSPGHAATLATLRPD